MHQNRVGRRRHRLDVIAGTADGWLRCQQVQIEHAHDMRVVAADQQILLIESDRHALGVVQVRSVAV